MLGGLDDKPAEIKANGGEQPMAFAYSDFGVDQVGYCIVTTKESLKNNPDLVKRFMQATIKAYKETEKNPDAAVAAMADIVGGTMNEDAGKAQARDVLDVTLGILYSAANKDKVLGLNVDSDWVSMVDLMKKYNNLDPNADPKSFYTNEFVKIRRRCLHRLATSRVSKSFATVDGGSMLSGRSTSPSKPDNSCRSSARPAAASRL